MRRCGTRRRASALISPPPHHDIYSIEDLAQLIYDLKNANPRARISVKLVAVAGVGTIAAGVAKAHADVVLISGHDGGTGASPLTSIKHGGVPWELGLAETQQVLQMNGLRDRIVVQVDGQLKTGRDVVVAALMGAEEFGFATAPLVVSGCVMMRVCHLNTCPVGIATQDPELRKQFSGKPEFVINFFRFIAEEVREHMARLGFRTMDEMIGRVDCLNVRAAVDHWKARGLDLSPILHGPALPAGAPRRRLRAQDHGLERALDHELIAACGDALEHGAAGRRSSTPIRNAHRSVGTMLGSEVTRRWGGDGLPDDTIRIRCTGSAGQSFGAFVPRGITLALEGDANDYVGKGLSGGDDRRAPPAGATFVAEDNIIVGNVVLYGATSGEAYIRGVAGERFAVRNSGAIAVVEGVGDHGCEYMTGGRVVVLGTTGRNFAAGMSGGIAYVLDAAGTFAAPLQPRAGRSRAARRGGRCGARAGSDRPPRAAHRQRARRAAAGRLGGHRASLRQGHAARLQARARRASGTREPARVDVRGHGGGGPWVSRPGSSRSPARSSRRGPSRSASATGARSTLPYPPGALEGQAARCMDCGIPFCHQGCPLGNLIPDWNDLVYRDRWRSRDRSAARDQQLSRVHRPAVSGAVRRRVRARHQQRAGDDQVDRSRDRRSRVRRGLDRRRGRRRRAPASASPSSDRVRPGSRPPIS